MCAYQFENLCRALAQQDQYRSPHFVCGSAVYHQAYRFDIPGLLLVFKGQITGYRSCNPTPCAMSKV
jgi:hypothetical protein